jgi:rhodanese-related sulfurtransferase
LQEAIMGLMRTIRSWFGGKKASLPPAPPTMGHDEPEPEVPEIEVDALKVALASDSPPLLLDVREPFEWRQARIPGAVHIPRSEVPQRMGTLPKDREIVVFCAHGSRSYGVAVYLCDEGYRASNLSGGISAWSRAGGAVEMG